MPTHATLTSGTIPTSQLGVGTPTGTKFLKDDGTWAVPDGGAGVTAHNLLTGLGSDDHTQYHNDARGDARYSQLSHNHTGVYAPVLGADDNYVTDAEKTKLSNLSGVNTGDQDLSGYSLTSHNHTGVYQPLATVLTNTTASFTTAQETKLSGIETGATADMTGGEIVSAIDTALGGTTWQGGGGTSPTVATLASDQATGANTTPVTLTGLSFSYTTNSKYRIWAMGRVQPTAATTGCGFQFDLSSAVTAIDVQFRHQLANTGTLSGGHSIADDASVGVSSGMPGTSTYPVTVQGLLVTGANSGTAQLRFRSETTAVTTCKAGFTLVVEKIA